MGGFLFAQKVLYRKFLLLLTYEDRKGWMEQESQAVVSVLFILICFSCHWKALICTVYQKLHLPLYRHNTMSV